MKSILASALAILAAAVTVMLVGCGGGETDGDAVKGPVIDGQEAYHVIVAGGEPEGVAAALAASRNGMKTLLIEEGEALGGLITLGWLNFLDMNYGPDRLLLTQGIFKEFHDEVGPGVVIDVEQAKEWFTERCEEEPNLTVMLNTEITAPVMDGNVIAGLEVREIGQAETSVIRSMAVIDATVDGDIAAATGAPYTVGGEDRGNHGLKQGVTLVFEVSGIDWDRIAGYLQNDGNPNTGADATSAWGYGEEALNYESVDGDMRFRGPNIALQRNGNVLLNALVIFEVDALDPQSYADGIARGVREITHIMNFMRENFIGFEDAEYVTHAPRLYVRETRHFIGEYRLTITDVLENRDHWDRVGHGSYPVDLQPVSPADFGNIIGSPDIYSIPFRCLVPLEIDQLLIVGRSASYDSLPHGSARVIPIGMVTGEAAGTAIAYSVEHGVTFRQMAHDPSAIEWLQSELISNGAYLIEYDPPRMTVMDHWAYPGVLVMRELGLVEGGYANDYRLETKVTNPLTLQNRGNRMIRIAGERNGSPIQAHTPDWPIELDADEVSVGLLLKTAALCASLSETAWHTQYPDKLRQIELTAFDDAQAAKDYLVSKGVIAPYDIRHFADFDSTADMGQLMYVLGHVYNVLTEHRP